MYLMDEIFIRRTPILEVQHIFGHYAFTENAVLNLLDLGKLEFYRFQILP